MSWNVVNIKTKPLIVDHMDLVTEWQNNGFLKILTWITTIKDKNICHINILHQCPGDVLYGQFASQVLHSR